MARRNQHAPLVVAIGGGKGGVGKSVVAANLAIAIAKLGARTTLVDSDLGSANLHTLFGIDKPGLTLQALVDGRVAELQEVIIPTGQPRLDLIPGSAAVPGAANLQHARKQKLIRHIAGLDSEVVVIDCGAGVHYNVLDFFAAADARLIVANSQLTSLQNAYGFLKAATYRVLRSHATALGAGAIFDENSDGSETETVRQLLDRVEVQHPGMADELRSVLVSTRVSLLGNQLGDMKELSALHALSRMAGDFLTLHVPVLGGLLRTNRIHESVTRRRPFMLDAGNDAESRLILQIAESILSINVSELRRDQELTSELIPSPDMAQPADPTRLPGEWGGYQRAHERLNVDWPVVVETPEGRRIARVKDISYGGVKVEFSRAQALASNAMVRIWFELKSSRAFLDARVVHCSAVHAGCVFEPEPAPHVISALLDRARVDPNAQLRTSKFPEPNLESGGDAAR